MRQLTFSAVLLLATTGGVSGQSAWLPPSGRISVTGLFLYQNSHRFYAGADLVPLRDRLQRTFAASVEYGLTDRLALDFSTGLGYNTLGRVAVLEKDTGLLDTNIGLRWRLIDERRHAFAPTFSIRAGGTIKGAYAVGRKSSIGDGASGAEVSVMLAKAFQDGRTGVFADSGLRKRDSGVPDDYFGSAGVYRTLWNISWSAGLRHTQALGGQTVGQPGYRAQWLKEVSQMAELGAGITDRQGRFYQLFLARQVRGRNTPDKLVVGMAVTFAGRPSNLFRVFRGGTP